MDDSRNTSSLATHGDASALRASVRSSHPEIERLYSDAYLSAVLAAPERTYADARDDIVGALDWRRSYGVEALVAAFRHDAAAGGAFVVADVAAPAHEGRRPFVPSPGLVDVCLSGAFAFEGFDEAGRGVLRVRAARLDWWKTGVDDGLRYHTLVIEHALRAIAERNGRGGGGGRLTEALVLYVDTSDLGLLPPPLGTLSGMARLLQQSYPARIQRVHIGPANRVLMALHRLVVPYLRPASRDKISLMERAPNKETVAGDGTTEEPGKAGEGTSR